MSHSNFVRLVPKAAPSFKEAGNFIARLRRDVRLDRAEIERAADQARCHALNERVRMCGYALMEAAPMIDAGTTLTQRCELLNINVADREYLTEADGLAALVLSHGKEDSAASRHLDYKDGPLFHAVFRVFIDFMTTTHDGQVGGRCTFSPGGLFFDSLCNPAAARTATATIH